jgi:hypothetical protein
MAKRKVYKEEKVYVHLDNGDFNDETCLCEIEGVVSFEMFSDRNFMFLTKNAIDGDKYLDIRNFIEKRLKNRKENLQKNY